MLKKANAMSQTLSSNKVGYAGNQTFTKAENEIKTWTKKAFCRVISDISKSSMISGILISYVWFNLSCVDKAISAK